MTVNQEINGGQWNLLGTYRLQVGQGHKKVVLTDQADQTVVADAIRLVAAPGPNLAIWTPTIPSSQDYQVYARWTSHPTRATDATYTVHHSGGITPVTVSQRINGGQWNHLGRYTFNPSSNHRVEVANRTDGIVGSSYDQKVWKSLLSG